MVPGTCGALCTRGVWHLWCTLHHECQTPLVQPLVNADFIWYDSASYPEIALKINRIAISKVELRTIVSLASLSH